MAGGAAVLARGPGLRRGRAGGGFTLVELIVVMSIMAVLLGIGVAGYVSLGRGLKITGLRNRIEAIVRQARNSTLYEGAPAGVFITTGDSGSVLAELRNPVEHLRGRVIVDRDDKIVFEVEGRGRMVEFHPSRLVRITGDRRVRAVGFRTVGQWHLEKSDRAAGYLKRGCRIEHGESAPGRIGGGVLLGKVSEGRGGITALAAPDDAFDPYVLPDGGRIELWVMASPKALGRESYLVLRRGSYALRVTSDGVLEGGTPGSVATAEGYELPVGRWVKLALEFSPNYVRVYADEVERAGAAGAKLAPAKKQKLVFGKGFIGVVDEIRVQRRVEGDSVAVPARFEVSGPAALFFDARGRLDPREHTGPVRYEVSRDGKKTGFRVTLAGMIERD